MKKSKVLLSSSSVLFIALIACFSTSTTPTENISTLATPINGDVPSITEAPVIQHQSMPGEIPLEHTAYAGDQDSSIYANERRALGGDRFTFNRFERPFNTQTMDIYFPYLDIHESGIFEDETWIYAILKVKGTDEQGNLPGSYAYELDMNLDGGGEWLVMVTAPSSAEWSVARVRVWFDENNDVGGTTTMLTDDPIFSGNGYETIVFEEGNGDDPDLAWARISPAEPTMIHFAFKKSLLSNDLNFMANAWAGNDDLNPEKFDFSDSYTHTQAGTSLVELQNFYPIKELSELDNACRMAIGFQPNGSEPGLCPLPVEPDTSCPAELIYCVNFGNQTICYCIEQ